MQNFVELWVYLSSAPLFGLTATLAVYVLAQAVAGELAIGVVLAGLVRVVPGFPDLAASAEAGVLANLGVILLMFMVGLESTVPQMLQVGLPSFRVAIIGVVVPMAAGLAGAWLLLPSSCIWPFMSTTISVV